MSCIIRGLPLPSKWAKSVSACRLEHNGGVDDGDPLFAGAATECVIKCEEENEDWGGIC